MAGGLTRRGVVAAALTGTAAGCATHAPAAGVAPSAERRGRPVVLVHGAWHGGWCWRDVRPHLEQAGAQVFTPTLTGLGERAHLRAPVPTLSTHIEDVAALITAEELTGVTLVGHSYGGMVITGVADRLRERIAGMVYLDAALPADGQSMITQRPGIMPAEAAAAEAQLARLAPDGVWMAPLPAQALGVPADRPDLIAWLERRMTPHPLPSWTQPLRLTSQVPPPPRTYVFCTNPVLPQSAFPLHAARIRRGEAGPGWTYRELPTGHEAIATMPQETAALILAAVS